MDLTEGCQESKKILKTTSFYTPSLFGPFPDSFSARLESAFSASYKYNSYILKLPTATSRSVGRSYDSKSPSRDPKRSRRDFGFHSSAVPLSGRSGYSDSRAAKREFFRGRRSGRGRR